MTEAFWVIAGFAGLMTLIALSISATSFAFLRAMLGVAAVVVALTVAARLLLAA